MDLSGLEVYKTSMELGRKTWEMVNPWNHLSKETIGKQWIRAADSIAANIGEAEGRYTFTERKRFYHISRGSLYESKIWLVKASERDLITKEQEDAYSKLLERCRILINGYIKYLKEK